VGMPLGDGPRARAREAHTPRLRGALRGVRVASPPRREQPHLLPVPLSPPPKPPPSPPADSPPPPAKASAAPACDPDAPLATVGLSLLHNVHGWWYVSRIATASSAHMCGRIHVLDELLNVDDVSISTRFTQEEVRQQLIGPLGSTSMLAFRRPARAAGEEDVYYALELVRNHVEADTTVLKPQKLRFVYVDSSTVECDFADKTLATQRCLDILGRTLRKTVALELALQRGVQALFLAWRDRLSSVFVLRILLKKAHVRRQYACKGRTLGLWQQNACTARRGRALLKQAVGKLQKRLAARAWGTWESCIDAANENKRRDAQLIKVAMRLLHAKLVAAFEQWLRCVPLG
jgi:hypothetical protein